MAELLSTHDEIKRRKKLFYDYQHTEDYREKIVQRLQINDACQKDPKIQALTWSLCARPENQAEGCIFFIENFGWTFDPRPQSAPHHLPMILFDYQKEAIRKIIESIENGTDMLFEKSRDMGASWLLFVYVPLWYWLFKDGSNFLVGSYKQDLVDNRTKDSIFGMLDYAIESLPLWILPNGFNMNKNRTQMKLINPANNNQITGDTMNPNFGRGSRKTAVLFDELGFWDYAKDAWESTGDVTACRIANSTPSGYNYYAGLRNKEGMNVYTMHWRQHPLKDDIWYEYEKARRTPEEVAQELDISYSKSLEGRVYPEWNDTNVNIGLHEYDDDLPLYVSWDFGREDPTAIIWAQVGRNNRLRIVDTYSKSGKHIEFFFPFITGVVGMDLMQKYDYTPGEMDMIDRHRQWTSGTHFGDPAGRFITQASDYSVSEQLSMHGIHINFDDSWKVFQKRKSASKLLIMDGVDINKTGQSEYFNMCMVQSSYPKVRKQGVQETDSRKPTHNWASHFRSSFEYLALGLDFYQNRTYKPYDKFKKKESSFGRKRGPVSY